MSIHHEVSGGRTIAPMEPPVEEIPIAVVLLSVNSWLITTMPAINERAAPHPASTDTVIKQRFVHSIVPIAGTKFDF